MLTTWQFSDLIQRRSAIGGLGSDLLTQAGGESDSVLNAAQAKASSVIQEASSVVAEVSKAIPKPTLIANMTAGNACLELLSFSKCHHIKLHWAFLAGFWLLLCTVTVTTATFFISHQSTSRFFSWSAIVLGSIAIALFQGLCISTWTVAEVVSSLLEGGSGGSNSRSIYLTFTCIAFISVVICIIVRRHRNPGNCDECDKRSVSNPSTRSSESSTSREESFSDTSTLRVGSFRDPQKPTETHPALRPEEGQVGVIEVTLQSSPRSRRNGSVPPGQM